MLAAYFDDSGTHLSSEFVLWAGVVGRLKEFEAMEPIWRAKLANPAPGYPPLKKFSLRDCVRGKGEFLGYEEGARDLLRRDMRKIIGDAGLKPVSYSVPVKQFNEIIRGRVLRAYGPADGFAFSACADFALKLAKRLDLPIECVFDQGQQRPWLDELLNDARSRAQSMGAKIKFDYATVVDSIGLQAADVVATEHYWYSLDAQASHPEPPALSPHFRSFIEMTNPDGFWMFRHDLEKLRREFLAEFPTKDWVASTRGKR